MVRLVLEVADIRRRHGPGHRRERADRLNCGQLRVMGAIEACRTKVSQYRTLAVHLTDTVIWHLDAGNGSRPPHQLRKPSPGRFQIRLMGARIVASLMLHLIAEQSQLR